MQTDAGIYLIKATVRAASDQVFGPSTSWVAMLAG
jgi:hypothetical protein